MRAALSSAHLAVAADVDGAVAAENLGADVVAIKGVAADLDVAQRSALEKHVDDGIVNIPHSF